MRAKTPSRKEELLRQIPLFAACTDKELSHVARLLDEADRAAGTVLMREGQVGSECFVIVSGQATATLNGKTLAQLGPGDAVGEMALLDNAPRSATVTADTDLHVFVLTPQSFDEVLTEPAVAKGLLRSLARRLREIEGAPRQF
jgi:CRP/FNR family cyclic AMP-dependent transcriptional regulator